MADLQTSVNYDRRTAARLGITPQLIDQSLYGAFGQAQISTILHFAEPISRRDGGGAAVYAKPTWA